MGRYNCTDIVFGNYSGGEWWDYESNVAVGYTGIGSYYACYVRFTTPNKSNMESITITIDSDYCDGIMVQYYLCKSWVNKNPFGSAAASGHFEDDDDGILSYNEMTYYGPVEGFTFTAADFGGSISPNTQYYVFFRSGWGRPGAGNGIIHMSNADITAYITEYTVTYDANGGTGAPSKGVHEVGQKHTVSNTEPTRSNSTESKNFTITGDANGGDANVSCEAKKDITYFYEFIGWNTNKSATTAIYTAGNTFSVNRNITLYAIWKKTEMNAVYSNNSISNLPIPTRTNVRNDYTLKLIYNNDKDNEKSISLSKIVTYSFRGWASESGSQLPSNQTFTSETTVRALWNENIMDNTVVNLETPSKDKIPEDVYTITLDTDGGSISGENILESTIGTAFSFLGWSKTADADGIVPNPYKVTESCTLTGIWEPYNHTDEVDLPSANKDNVKFLGWVEDKDSGIFVPNPYIPSKSVTLYAVYKLGKDVKSFLWHNGKWWRVMINKKNR